MSRDSDGTETHVIAQSLTAFSVRRFVLRVIDGPDHGLEVEIDGASPQRLLMGKSPACEVRLGDPEVSRRHAALTVVDNELVLTDLSSTNGSFVDDVRVGVAFLRGGERIRLGGTTLELCDAGQAPGAPASSQDGFGEMLGTSDAMRRLYPLCERLAKANIPVIIEGESGTGKEVLARALHACGSRRDAPLVVFDCTAVTPSLIESELFGHTRGAFTGSLRSRAGVFERADGGTLFIDEIGDMPLELQAKLLRAIERGAVTRVGDDETRQVDVRVLTATRRDLDLEVAAGRFRDDLFHRIAVARIELPPLRARRGDVRLLVEHFCRGLGASPKQIPPELIARWEASSWPGNVRELRNAVMRRIALGDLSLEPEAAGDPATSIPVGVTAPATPQGDSIARVLAEDLPLADARQVVIDELEARYVAHQLELHAGDIDRAAAASGVARRQFFRLKAKAAGRR